MSIKISIFGDADTRYAGSVVKAMASAKNGYKNITADVESYAVDHVSRSDFFSKINSLVSSTIEQINILSSDIVEIIIRSPLSARNFRPGQFYRLQNYCSIDSFTIEPIALTGAYVRGDCISLIALEVGWSTKCIRKMKVGSRVVLMGPVGDPTYIPSFKNVVLIGGGLGNAVLFSIGKAMRQNGCNVIYFAGYRKPVDIFKIEHIEEASDVVVWSCEDGDFNPSRSCDFFVKGNIIDSINSMSNSIKNADHVLMIGSDGMMSAVSFHVQENSMFSDDCALVCVLNSPMQCMMNGICAQCIQKIKKNGCESYIYACKNQDQNAKYVDFKFLKDRLSQNYVQEKISLLYND